MSQLRMKGASFAPFADRAREDFTQVILQHENAFDALLYKAVTTVTANNEDINSIEFSDLNNRVDGIKYHDPVQVVCVESTSEDEHFMPNIDGDESMGFGDVQTLTARIAADVPEGSIIEFLVMLSDGGSQRQSWYIHRSKAIGQPAIGYVHYAIPCPCIDPLAIEPIKAAELAPEIQEIIQPVFEEVVEFSTC